MLAFVFLSFSFLFHRQGTEENADDLILSDPHSENLIPQPMNEKFDVQVEGFIFVNLKSDKLFYKKNFFV